LLRPGLQLAETFQAWRRLRVDKARFAIYIDREGCSMSSPLSMARRKTVLVVLFIPSVQRDGITVVEQDRWVQAALEMLGKVFGGATAYPKARGIWRDDARGGTLVKDEPIVMHCSTTPLEIQDEDRLEQLGTFCRSMGRQTGQGEVGLVIGDEYLAIRDFG
jgi:hypothetical protein